MAYNITYQTAKIVAKEVEKHFTSQHAAAPDGLKHAPTPSEKAIEVMVDVIFWASLHKEEGNSYKISIAYLPPDNPTQPLKFKERLPFSSKVLTKLAPAVERPGIQIGVWNEGDEFFVWGATRELPSLCFVLEVIEPGMLVIKHSRLERAGKFYNVAVLKGDEVKIIDPGMVRLPGCPRLLRSMLSFSPADHERGHILMQLAISMRAHGRGGILLVVPAESSSWRTSILERTPYMIVPPFSRLKQIENESPGGLHDKAWYGKIQKAIAGIAGLTAVDGAMIINNKYEVYAFGAKIIRAPKGDIIEKMVLTEPVRRNSPQIIHPAGNGGTRHLSAAQFVNDQHDSLALVASQDGKFTIFGWSEEEEMVHAHRVDTLLM